VTWRTTLRVAAGIAIGLGLASVPFLQYRLHAHHHATDVANAHH
jgi:hypothetical protein